MSAQDWLDVKRIYHAGIATGHATFESKPPSWAEFDRTRLLDHRHVLVTPEGSVVGWVAAVPVSNRAAYSGVVEHSVYVDPAAQGRGCGGRLLRLLIQSTESAGIWTIQSGVFPENEASIAMHLTNGFRIVGTRERVARMSYGPLTGEWRDVVLLERRSPVVD